MLRGQTQNQAWWKAEQHQNLYHTKTKVNNIKYCQYEYINPLRESLKNKEEKLAITKDYGTTNFRDSFKFQLINNQFVLATEDIIPLGSTLYVLYNKEDSYGIRIKQNRDFIIKAFYIIANLRPIILHINTTAKNVIGNINNYLEIEKQNLEYVYNLSNPKLRINYAKLLSKLEYE